MAKVKIVVLDPQDVYFPGQTVRGHVILDPNDVTNVQRKFSLKLLFKLPVTSVIGLTTCGQKNIV